MSVILLKNSLIKTISKSNVKIENIRYKTIRIAENIYKLYGNFIYGDRSDN